jgi:uncharacterized protein (DUF302 family)
MSIALSLSTILHTSFDDAVARTRKALADEGFGVLTEIDVKATLKSKLGAEIEDYLILGACNPLLAHRAVTIDSQIGLLLPCNVVVRVDSATEGTVIVEAINPQMLVDLTGQPMLQEVAEQATGKLHAAIDAVAATPTSPSAP